LIDSSILKKFDPSEMHKVYDMWPQIGRRSYELDFMPKEIGKVNHVVFSGMGGSGAIGDFFQSILSQSKIHVTVVKGYTLPKTVDSNTLVIPISVSGNTDESLTILKIAKKADYRIISISSGGQMAKFCNENNIPHYEFQSYHSPRASFISFVYSFLKILSPIISLNKNDILHSLDQLDILSKKISTKNLEQDNPSLSLAKWIKGIPMIYYPFGLESAAIRFKNSIQENAKNHAFVENILESCHNGIVSWERKSQVVPILLRGQDDHFKTKERWEIIKEYFIKNNIDFKEIISVKGNILSKLVCLIYLLDYASIYMAILTGIDPTPITPVDFVKKRLKVD